MKSSSFYSTTLGRRYEYNLILPEDYERTGLCYPVLYLLHGRSESKESWLQADSIIRDLIHAGDIPQLIVVLPDAPSSNRAGYYVNSLYTGNLYPAEQVESAFIDEFIPRFDSTYRTLSSRENRLIGGYSMGAYGALRYCLAHPTVFSKGVILSPSVFVPVPPPESSARLFGAFGRGDCLFDDAVYEELNYPAQIESFVQAKLASRLFVAVGDQEKKNPLFENRMHDLDMEAHQVFNWLVRVSEIDITFRVYGGGHDWDVWNRGLIDGLRFLFK